MLFIVGVIVAATGCVMFYRGLRQARSGLCLGGTLTAMLGCALILMGR